MKIFLPLFTILSAASFALETSSIDFRDGADNDDTTRIYRENNSLMFDDAETTTPVSLLSLFNQRTSHDALDNLSADDHAHYLNDARHIATHSTSFNRDLPIGLDHNNNTTLGGHLDDPDIHLKRQASEMIEGAWTFQGDTKFNSNQVTIENMDTLDSVGINFATSLSTGTFSYDVIQGHFTMNSPLLAQDLIFNNSEGNKLAIETSLMGYSSGMPAATIAGFSSIEGIASDELLSSGVDESITGSWNFLKEMEVEVSTNSSAFDDQAMRLNFQSNMTGSGTLDGRHRNGFLLDHTASFDSIATLDDLLYAGVTSNMAIDSAVTGTPSGLGIGILGAAESNESAIHAIGLAGITNTSSAGVRRIGVLGAETNSILSDSDALPKGNHAGVFLGDVVITETVSARGIALTAEIESGQSLALGDVLEWTSNGRVQKGSASTTGTAPYAGIALEAGSSLEEINIAYGGVTEFSTTAIITAGNEVAWNGAQLTEATGSDVRIIGTALNSHAGGSSGTVNVQINLDYKR